MIEFSVSLIDFSYNIIIFFHFFNIEHIGYITEASQLCGILMLYFCQVLGINFGDCLVKV